MFNISDISIRDIASHKSAYEHGCQMVNNVRDLEFMEFDNMISATVEEDYSYRAVVRLSQNYKVQSFACQCMEFYKTDGACRHIVALLKKAQEKYGSDKIQNSKDVFIPFNLTKNHAKYIKAQLWIVHDFANIFYKYSVILLPKVCYSKYNPKLKLY